MSERSIDWPWLLTKLAIAFLLAHFLFIGGVGLFLPAGWSQMASLIALGLVFLAVASFLVVLWLDYGSSADGALPRYLLEALAIAFLVVAVATILEESFSVSWWMAAAATGAIIVPIWWLYPRRSNTGQQW